MSSLKIFAFTLVIAASCRPPQSSTTTLTSSDPQLTGSENRVALSIAAARCDGSGLGTVASCATSYPSRDVCLASERHIQGKDLDLPYCPTGMDEHQIDLCVAAMGRMPCGVSARAVVECRADRLCPPQLNETKP